MADRTGEAGTTLAELLVVITILLVIGTVTTTGIVRGFNAQLAASNTAETLDGTRIATQRVRDFVRGANEVCASSTATSLVLWTDDDGDGTSVDTELDIFELVTDPSGTDVFQRRTPTAGGDVTQLIRDDIINAALFTYDVAPADQPGSLVCTDGVTPSGGPSAIRIVDVQFTVANPDPAEADLTTQTEVRLRNADLSEGTPNIAPVAAFSTLCPDPDRSCDFDASASSDTDGAVVSYAWTFTATDGTDVGTATGVAPSFTFPVGDATYDVTLVVTDDQGATATLVGSAAPVEPGTNAPPTADFDFTCTGRICDFDATASTDDDGITDWDWDFAGAATATGVTPTYTFPTDGSHAVTLTVTDTDGATTDRTLTVTASNSTIYVSNMTGVRGGSGSSRTATFTVTLSRTVGGPADAGITVTISMDPATSAASTSSCTTNASGQCSTTLTGLKNADFPVVGTVVSVTNTGTQTYDAEQNTTDTHTVS